MIFLNSVSFAAALVFYLPCVCTHTNAEGKTEKGQSPEYFKFVEKNTIYIEHPVAVIVEIELEIKVNQSVKIPVGFGMS